MMRNEAALVVTMDSGILHLAGTTDVHILQLGSSIHPKLRAPWRNGSQSYNYDYVLITLDNGESIPIINFEFDTVTDPNNISLVLSSLYLL